MCIDPQAEAPRLPQALRMGEAMSRAAAANYEALRASHAELLDALQAADAVLKHLPNMSTNNDGQTPLITTRQAEARVRRAIENARGLVL